MDANDRTSSRPISAKCLQRLDNPHSASLHIPEFTHWRFNASRLEKTCSAHSLNPNCQTGSPFASSIVHRRPNRADLAAARSARACPKPLQPKNFRSPADFGAPVAPNRPDGIAVRDPGGRYRPGPRPGSFLGLALSGQLSALSQIREANSSG